ncbi:metalloregulator ArsR/SmtB family transcription factor [Burkholderiaceae bacterium DAT-1]|nr:metalloregulator ArsR/SmtB family transcription factor [Burkholderiaceae bacterium DAT-1]
MYTEAASFFRTFGNQDRLALLNALDQASMTVTEMEQRTGIRQPTLSQQLAVLRQAGLVETSRDGKFVHYSLTSGRALIMLGMMRHMFELSMMAEPSVAAGCVQHEAITLEGIDDQMPKAA